MVTYEQAKKITNIFFDDKIDKSFVISLEDTSFRKSEIRYVRKINDKEKGIPRHWIIYNLLRPSIWKQPYSSYEEAKKEFDFQISQLHPNQKHNFVIEDRGGENQDEIKNKLENTKVIKDEDFSDFDEVTQHALSNF